MKTATLFAKEDPFDKSEQIIHYFDRFAGANFGVALFQGYYESSANTLNPFVLWNIACRALIDGGNPVEILQAQHRQLEELMSLTAHCEEGVATKIRKSLIDILNNSWAFWLPYVLFSPEQQCRIIGETWMKDFPSSSLAQQLLQKLLFDLLANGGIDHLFNAEGLGSKFLNASPAECVVIQIGKRVRDSSKKEENPEAKEILEQWRSALHMVLQTLGQAKRVMRGFALENSDFEDLVLALLAVAEWRLQPDIWRISSYIETCSKLPMERMTMNQLILSGALFGLLQGYRHLGDNIADRSWRQYLTRYALVLSIGFVIGIDQETRDFYLSPTGEIEALPAPLSVQKMHRITEHMAEKSSEGITLSIKDTFNFELRLADLTPDFHFVLDYKTSHG